MLDEDVIEAVKAGTFKVTCVDTLEVLSLIHI